MTYVLGIDIGTSFTAAAVYHLDGDQRPAPQALNLGLRSVAVPSIIFLGEDGQVLVGEAAERRASDHPHRVVREFKRRVGDAIPIFVGDLAIAPEDIYATMARWVVDRAEEREGTPPDAVILSHPANWGGYKTTLIREALAGTGLTDVMLISEPEAAALHYATQERIEVGSTVAVYDLGGGTFDVAIMRKDGEHSFSALGRPEGIERLGGADFDHAVLSHVAESLGGLFNNLDPLDPGVLVALSRLRRECGEAKEALSFDSEAAIPVLLPGVQTQVRLVRSEFEAMIDDLVRETIGTLGHAMQVAEIDADDLSAILLIGGSSRIPLVAQLLSAELRRPISIDADPKASISLGAVFSAAGMLKAMDADTAAAESRQDSVEDAGAPSGITYDAGSVPFLPVVAGPAKALHTQTGLRAVAVAAAAAAFIVLTGTAAQSPSGLIPLTALMGAQNGSEDSEALTQAQQTAGRTDLVENAGVPLSDGMGVRASLNEPMLPEDFATTAPGAAPTSASVNGPASGPGPKAPSPGSNVSDAPNKPATPTPATPSSATPRHPSDSAPDRTTLPSSVPVAPGPVAPGAVGPEPVPVEQPEPGPVEPAPAPVPVGPGPVAPEPEPVEPAPEPAPVEPEPVEPAPVEPAPEPAPVEPEPVDPEPVPADPGPAPVPQEPEPAHVAPEPAPAPSEPVVAVETEPTTTSPVSPSPIPTEPEFSGIPSSTSTSETVPPVLEG